MLDPQKLRIDPEAVARALRPRGYELDLPAWRQLEEQRKELQIRMQDLQNRKNQDAREIGQAKSRGEDITALLQQVKNLGDDLASAEAEFTTVKNLQTAWAMEMPNLALPEVPQGRDESANLELRRWGQPHAFDFEPRDHVALGESNGLMDAESAARLAGARFTVLKGSFSRLHRALAQYMLDVHAGLDACLGDTQHPPLDRVRRFFEMTQQSYRKEGYMGCLLGGLGQELSGVSEVFRRKIEKCFADIAARLAVCLEAARQRGDIPSDTDVRRLASLLVDCWEGAALRSRLRRNAAPLKAMLDFLFRPATAR